MLNPLRYPHHSCKISAPPKNMNMRTYLKRRDKNTDGRSVGETIDPKIQYFMGSLPAVGGLRDPAIHWCPFLRVGGPTSYLHFELCDKAPLRPRSGPPYKVGWKFSITLRSGPINYYRGPPILELATVLYPANWPSDQCPAVEHFARRYGTGR